MSEPSQKPPTLASYLQPVVPAARLSRNREAIQRRLSKPAPWSGLWFASAACAAALVVGVWMRQSEPAPVEQDAASVWQPSAGKLLESQQQAIVATLPDGTRVDLEPRTTLAPGANEASKVELELRRGRAAFDVTHNPARQFRVRAGSVSVVVLGTRFSVARLDGKVTVVVERGKVAVEQGSAVQYLTPGQRWEGADLVTEQPAAPPSPPANAVDSAVSAVASADEAIAPSSDVASPRTLAKPNVSDVTATEPHTPNPAKELFDASREARRNGDSRQAAQLLQELVTRYPNDPRAGLAAFELGRIRADVLGDLSGAITAFEQALRLSPRGSFRQDALARLAQAYDRAGRTAACRATRQRYLDAHGEGVHAQRVLKLCP